MKTLLFRLRFSQGFRKGFDFSKFITFIQNGCYMFLLKGTIKEVVYNHNLIKTNTNIYNSPSVSFINDDIGYHCIRPMEKSISIHIYHPKKHKTKYFINNK